MNNEASGFGILQATQSLNFATVEVLKNISTSNTTTNVTQQFLNITSDNVESSPYKGANAKWPSLIIIFAATFVLCYVIANMCVYILKKKSPPKRAGSNNPGLHTSIFNGLVMVVAISSLLYVVIAIPMVSPVSSLFCSIYYRFSGVLYGISLSFTYGVLWYRVHVVFYSKQAVKDSITPIVKAVNFSVLGLLVIGAMVNFTIFFLTPTYDSVPEGCIAGKYDGDVKISNILRVIILMAFAVMYQVFQWISFVYSLYATGLKGQNNEGRGFDQKYANAVIKRSTIVCAVCVISDIITQIFHGFYNDPLRYLIHTVHVLNLIVNLLGVLFSFADWKERLMPYIYV